MRFTCSLCGRETYLGTWGLCSTHYKQWTVTGSHPLPEWLKIFSKEHHREERKKYNTELPFTEYEERSLSRGGNPTEATKQMLIGE